MYVVLKYKTEGHLTQCLLGPVILDPVNRQIILGCG